MFESSSENRRRSIRLSGYDYSFPGAYFVTLCAQDRACLFGYIKEGTMFENDAGRMIRSVWEDIPIRYPGTDIDAFQVMPNHIHGIILLQNVGAGPCACPNDEGRPQGVAPTISLSDIVGRFKSMTTKRYIDGVRCNGWRPFDGKVWQRNYWEHIVRNEDALNDIHEYITGNPAEWERDELYRDS